MPPKKKVPQPSAKNKAASKAKNTDDKTFGLKNKNKSKKVQQQINQITAGADGGLQKKREADKKRAAEEKKAAELAKKEAAQALGIQQAKVPFGVDPKSILCEFFKQGVCNKGTKCKFSHDLDVGRKVVKKDLYTDAREEKEEDTMDKWDEEKLRNVIMSKHGNPKTTTDIVCKFFIEAVENGKYGWFWVCPNGGNECKYRHSLPAGFVLKTKEEKRLERLADENAPKITLEEFIELERGRLDRTKFTPITWESFLVWKKATVAKREDELKKEAKKPLTGKEIILKKFADKYYTEDASTEDADAFDLSVFKKDLPEDTEENVKDYGEGFNFYEEAQAMAQAEIDAREKAAAEVAEPAAEVSEPVAELAEPQAV